MIFVLGNLFWYFFAKRKPLISGMKRSTRMRSKKVRAMISEASSVLEAISNFSTPQARKRFTTDSRKA